MKVEEKSTSYAFYLALLILDSSPQLSKSSNGNEAPKELVVNGVTIKNEPQSPTMSMNEESSAPTTPTNEFGTNSLPIDGQKVFSSFRSSHIKIRGRTYNPAKPISFNALWTEEEQKKLEELLSVYPEEEVASRRWEKIANALGTRTPKQVASRFLILKWKVILEPKNISLNWQRMEKAFLGGLLTSRYCILTSYI